MVSLRLVVNICQSHTSFYGAAVDVKGSHALLCKCRIIRHSNLNDVILRSLTRANILATREPNGPFRTKVKDLIDGLTLLLWHESRSLVWDVTTANTTASSFLQATSTEAGSAAE